MVGSDSGASPEPGANATRDLLFDIDYLKASLLITGVGLLLWLIGGLVPMSEIEFVETDESFGTKE